MDGRYCRCKLCGYIFSEEDLEESIESHLHTKHFIGYQEYYETLTIGNPYIECWKCGSPRYILSPYLSDIYLPCQCCIGDTKQSSPEIRNEVIGRIKDYLGKIGKSKSYQYLLSMSKKDRKRLLPINFEIQDKNILSLKRRDNIRIEKSTLFQIKSDLGRSSEISERNLGSLRLIPIEVPVVEVGDQTFEIGTTGYKIVLPEITPFDSKHHSRNSILNPGAKRPTKKLRFSGTGECIKFWNHLNQTTRSILKLTDSGGKSVSFQDIQEETKWTIKNSILRTKPIFSRIIDIYTEILRYLGKIEDSVFLSNSIDIPGPSVELGMKFDWSWEEQDYLQDQGIIKLSIL